jgi:hypothetical protein
MIKKYEHYFNIVDIYYKTTIYGALQAQEQL